MYTVCTAHIYCIYHYVMCNNLKLSNVVFVVLDMHACTYMMYTMSRKSRNTSNYPEIIFESYNSMYKNVNYFYNEPHYEYVQAIQLKVEDYLKE